MFMSEIEMFNFIKKTIKKTNKTKQNKTSCNITKFIVTKFHNQLNLSKNYQIPLRRA